MGCAEAATLPALRSCATAARRLVIYCWLKSNTSRLRPRRLQAMRANTPQSLSLSCLGRSLGHSSAHSVVCHTSPSLSCTQRNTTSQVIDPSQMYLAAKGDGSWSVHLGCLQHLSKLVLQASHSRTVGGAAVHRVPVAVSRDCSWHWQLWHTTSLVSGHRHAKLAENVIRHLHVSPIKT